MLTFCEMHLHADELYAGKRVINEIKVLIAKFPTVHFLRFEGSDTCTRMSGTGSRTPKLSPVPAAGNYSMYGATISAKELRALFSLDFTVPRLQSVISAISS